METNEYLDYKFVRLNDAQDQLVWTCCDLEGKEGEEKVSEHYLPTADLTIISRSQTYRLNIPEDFARRIVQNIRTDCGDDPSQGYDEQVKYLMAAPVFATTTCTSSCKAIVIGTKCTNSGCNVSGNTCTDTSCGAGCMSYSCVKTSTGLMAGVFAQFLA